MKVFKFKRGFTLADMMVATAIIVTLSVVLVVNFRVGRQRDELRNAGLLLASLINQAQAYALAGRTVTVGGTQVYPPGGWGVSFNAATDRVYLFADDGDGLFNDGNELWQEILVLSDYKVFLNETEVCLDLGSGCQTVSRIDYVFVPPLGNASILDNPVNQGRFEIILRHINLSGKGLRLSSRAASGQVILGLIEDIP